MKMSVLEIQYGKVSQESLKEVPCIRCEELMKRRENVEKHKLNKKKLRISKEKFPKTKSAIQAIAS